MCKSMLQEKRDTLKSLQELTNLKKELAPHSQSSLKKSIWQLINTIVPFLLLWGMAYVSFSFSLWLSLAFVIPAAGFSIRTFIIFHDCCHQSFFKSKKANEIIGNLTGILTFFPYDQWKNEHSIHHATSGNLCRRGTGDIWILTADEYKSLPFWKRLAYRLYRNPLIMFGLGPVFLLLIVYRANRKNAKRKERMNTYLTNTLLVCLMVILCLTLNWKAVLFIQGVILYLSAVAGIWLFYVQHQFEGTYFEHSDKWNYVSAAIHGSSYYKLPKILQWITGNIGFHHIHHLDPMVPNYHLQKTHESVPSLQQVPSVRFFQSMKLLRYRLWDEATNRFIGFKEVNLTGINSRASDVFSMHSVSSLDEAERGNENHR